MPVVGIVCKAAGFEDSTRLWDFFTTVRSAHALSEWMCACSTCVSEDLCVRLMLENAFLAGVEGDAVWSLAVDKQRAVLD